jgi:hypothetical protein
VTSAFNPSVIPNEKKKKFLQKFTEDEFRDQVVRPLFVLKGLIHGKDLCGPTEDGKDCYFFYQDPVRGQLVYAVQTKRGDLKMSSKARDNVVSAVTQLQTALGTVVKNAATRQTYRPASIQLVASGEINQRAQDYITDEVRDNRIGFLDSDALIPDIDLLMPELWFGIDAKTVPYLRNLRRHLVEQSDTIDGSQTGARGQTASPITEDAFVQLYLYRYTAKIVRERGTTSRQPDLDQLPVQHVLRRSERLILITGEAGSGKTTSLRRIALILLDQALAADDAEIPVLVNATDAVAAEDGADARLLDTIWRVTAKLTPEARACFTREALTAGRVTVLIDGYDELSGEAERIALLASVRQFYDQFPNCRLILSSRDYSFVERVSDHAPFSRYHISPINFKQAEKLIHRLSRGKAVSPETTQEMLRRLENIHGMELNPLLVSVYVAATDYSRQDIPANITELFKKFTEMMLGRWDQGKGLAQQYHAPLKDFLLCKLAYQMHHERVTNWSLDRCLEVFRSELADRGLEANMPVLVDEMLHRSGLVRVDDGRVRFRHLLIQEFFAGRGLPSPDALDALVGDPWWMRAVVFYFGQNPSNHDGLLALARRSQAAAGEVLYNSAIAVGWSLQACYLTKVFEKVEVLKWVVDALAATKEDFAAHTARTHSASPITQFLCYYLYARDAVAAAVVKQVSAAVFAAPQDGPGGETADARQFWCLVGLIESGQLETAAECLKKYRPADLKLLLALYIGCFYAWKMTYSTPAQKKLAEKLCAQISPKISGIQQQMLAELKGLLLEVQQGHVKVLDATADASATAEGRE